MPRQLSHAARLLAIACLAANLLSAQQEQPQYWAVIIGVSQFAHLPKEEWLDFADADARDFHRFILSPRGRAFPPENVFPLINDAAGHAAMRTRLGSTLAKKVRPEDTVYIFVATHGMVEREAAHEGYLLGYDSDREDLYPTALPMKELSYIIQARLRAKRVFLFADACRAGKLSQLQGSINTQIMDLSKQRGETMGLLASRPNEFSYEEKRFGGGHGVFTYFLLRGLMGEADDNKDQIVSADELIAYLQGHVQTATDNRQHVREFGDFEGKTPLSFLDQPGPADLKLARRLPPWGTLLASLVPAPAESDELRTAFQRALAGRRLLEPARDSAWELYQRFTGLPVPQSQKDDLKDDLMIGLLTEGEKVIASYRRGDQMVHLDASNYQAGAELFAHASQLSPADRATRAKANFLEARALIANRRYAQAIALLREAIALDPDAAYSYNALGIAYMDQEQWREALENFHAASARAEKWVYPHSNLGRVYAALRRYRDAEQEFKKGIQLGADLKLRYAYLHYNLGTLYVEQGRIPEAEQQFRRAIEMNPGEMDSYYHLGIIYQGRGRISEAEMNYRKAADLDPGFAEPRLKLAEMYRQQSRHEQEERVLREAVAGRPDDAAALEALGKALLRNRKFAEAEQVFLRLLAADPNAPLPLVRLGDVYVAQGKWEQAVEHYRQALARTSDPKVRAELQKKLSAVEKKK